MYPIFSFNAKQILYSGKHISNEKMGLVLKLMDCLYTALFFLRMRFECQYVNICAVNDTLQASNCVVFHAGMKNAWSDLIVNACFALRLCSTGINDDF